MISPGSDSDRYRNNLYVIVSLTVFSILLMRTQFCTNSSIERSHLPLTERVDTTTWGILSADTDLTLFAGALKTANLWSMMEKGRTILVFAPTNSGLRDQGSAFLFAEEWLNEDNDARLQFRLKSHIVENPVWPVNFSSYHNESTTLKTLSGTVVPLRLIHTKIVVGRDAFVTKMVKTSNGVILYLDRMLLSRTAALTHWPYRVLAHANAAAQAELVQTCKFDGRQPQIYSLIGVG